MHERGEQASHNSRPQADVRTRTGTQRPQHVDWPSCNLAQIVILHIWPRRAGRQLGNVSPSPRCVLVSKLTTTAVMYNDMSNTLDAEEMVSGYGPASYAGELGLMSHLNNRLAMLSSLTPYGESQRTELHTPVEHARPHSRPVVQLSHASGRSRAANHGNAPPSNTACSPTTCPDARAGRHARSSSRCSCQYREWYACDCRTGERVSIFPSDRS